MQVTLVRCTDKGKGCKYEPIAEQARIYLVYVVFLTSLAAYIKSERECFGLLNSDPSDSGAALLADYKGLQFLCLI